MDFWELGQPIVGQVVGGIFPVLTLRPACRRRLFTIAANTITPHLEILIDILAGRGLGRRREPRLDSLDALKPYQSLMLSLAQRGIPLWRFDISIIDRAGQYLIDALVVIFSAGQVYLKGRLPPKGAFYINLSPTTSRGTSSEHLLAAPRRDASILTGPTILSLLKSPSWVFLFAERGPRCSPSSNAALCFLFIDPSSSIRRKGARV